MVGKFVQLRYANVAAIDHDEGDGAARPTCGARSGGYDFVNASDSRWSCVLGALGSRADACVCCKYVSRKVL